MNISEIRKKIITNISYSLAIVVILSFALYYKINQTNLGKNKIEQIKKQTLEIKSNTEVLLQKTEDIKKYRESWKTISDSKKSLGGIKIDEINNKLTKTASKQGIINQKIQVSLPKEMKEGIFNCKTITVISSSVQLSFSALNDTRAVLFISDFTNSLPGYVVIEKIEIKRFKKYSDQDLFEISSGKDVGAVEGQIKFYWYAYKEKSKS